MSHQFLIPERLETARLLLRPFREEDWQAMHRHYSDPACTRYTLGRSLSEGESWRLTATLAGHWLLRGYGPYALEEKASGQLVGTCGLWFPGDFPEREIKWAVLSEHQGKGFASEAAQAVLAMALAHFPERPPISFIHRDNAASIGVARSIGAVLEDEIDFRNARFVIYRHAACVVPDEKIRRSVDSLT
ncbi:MAG TPA: GNAT family N-acetyltransferase [Azonexus sp.]|nr:GNAT family N-acetyltransferase [Azonexus sp.]